MPSPHFARAAEAEYHRIFFSQEARQVIQSLKTPEVVRDNMGHANIDVTQNVYGKSWWEERVDAVTRAVKAVDTAAKAADKEVKQNQPEGSNERVPLWVPQPERKIASC